jgi:TonB-linked SusC/RagA family outer membrane protein
MYKIYIRIWYTPPGCTRQFLRIMKLLFIFMTACLMQVSASTYAQRITLTKKNASLTSIFDQINRQSGLNFLVTSELLKGAKPVDINVKDEEVREVLDKVFENQPLSYTIEDNAVIVSRKTPSFIDNIIARFTDIDVRGRVVDEQGNPLPNASIQVKGKAGVYKSNDKGEFVIPNVPDDAILVIRYIGYKQLEIGLKGAVMPLEIKLNVATGELEEVKITYNTGYETIDKTRSTGSFVKVDNELINRGVGADIISRLINVTPGLLYDIRPINGNAGSTARNKLQIRGQYTLAQNSIDKVDQPLIVIDNFPFDGDITSLNPNDIEDVTILRDAAAASIWGARAGNGVIVITTKKAKYDQAPRISISSRINITEKPDLFGLNQLSSPEMINVERFLFGKGFYDSDIDNPQQPGLTPAVEILLKQRNGKITQLEVNNQLNALSLHDLRNDYLKYVFRKGITQSYNASFSVGGNKTSTLFNAGYDQDIGQSIGNENERITLRLANNFHPTENLQIQLGVNFSQQNFQNNGINWGGLAINNRAIPIYTSLVDGMGNPVVLDQYFRSTYTDTVGKGRLLSWKYNPLNELRYNDKTTKSQNLLANVSLNYKIINSLTASVDYQYQLSSSTDRDHRSLETYYTRDLINQYTNLSATNLATKYPVPMGGILGVSNTTGTSYGARGKINYNESWNNGTHILSAFAGVESRQSKAIGDQDIKFGYNDRLSQTTVNLNTAYPLYLGGTFPIAGFVAPSLSERVNRFVSIFGNASYTYLNRYTVSSSLRNDASNIFGVKTNEKGRPFWSTGAAWSISKEPFYRFDAIQDLKLRVTYGYSGNIDPSVTARTIVNYSTTPLSLSNLQYSSLITAPNPTLRWEKVRTFNIAVDFASRNQRISGSIEYYRKNSTDVITDETLEYTTGMVTIKTNSADITGNGLDVYLNTINVANANFKWTSRISLSSAFYKVSKLKRPPITNYNSTSGLSNFAREGYNPNVMISYRWAGLDQKNGDPLVYVNEKTVNTTMGNTFTESDVMFHESVPTYFGNILNDLTWRNISLSANITYKFGYYFRRPSANYSELLGFVHNINPEYLKRWQNPGDERFTNVPSLSYPVINSSRDDIYNSSSINVEKADHIRWNDIRIGYTINKLKKSLPFRNIDFYCLAGNLNILLWKANDEGLDPENTGVNIPTPKSIAFGLNASF